MNTQEQLLGTSILGQSRPAASGASFRARNPATGQEVGPEFWTASSSSLDEACRLAAQAFPVFSTLSGRKKALFMRQIASNIELLGADLFERFTLESGLPLGRARNETARTCLQLRLFADLVEQGSWVDARIDKTDAEGKPLRVGDICSLLRPIGPVAVFGASNFPLAFSVAGGDTASAFAAGNPVIVKAHPAHPGTSEMAGEAIRKAVEQLGLPAGTFSLLFDGGFEIGAALVKRPEIMAVGFTGSRKGGLALLNAMNSRPVPIPFYAEMSSLNPIFILPGALREGSEEVATGLFGSVTLGAGQFCTKPGLVFLRESPETEAFASRLVEFISGSPQLTLLTSGIRDAYRSGLAGRLNSQGVETLRNGTNGDEGVHVGAALFRTDAKSFLADSHLSEEIFGPATLLVTYSTDHELHMIASRLEGQLTATIHGTAQELRQSRELLAILETKTGRLVFNGFPTGVEVNHAIVHGGPWPATSDGRSTSVGARAIARFARPVCYQNFPQESLPEELQHGNPLGIWRTVNGNLTRE